MKIREAIEKLQALEKEHPDKEIYWNGDYLTTDKECEVCGWEPMPWPDELDRQIRERQSKGVE